MCSETLDETVCLKRYISQSDYKEISDLERLCFLEDQVNLKLELDYRLNICKTSEIGLQKMNEFYYYIDKTLVAYLNISSFGGNVGEINGMTHPAWRRKGLLKKLMSLAIEESKKRNFNELFLLSDHKSNAGIKFIESIGGKYASSEYRMKYFSGSSYEPQSTIHLRKAQAIDSKEIAKQNGCFFNDQEEEGILEEETSLTENTYMIEIEQNVIGKIRIDYTEASAFICGFVILPEFRGKGYGKLALKETLNLIKAKHISDIQLDVSCENATALNLYKSCDFQELSAMDYYKYND